MKGVSPVVATVLMVAVAIAAAVVAYSWVMSMQASVQAEASRGAGTVGKERFAVEPIECSTGTLTFRLRNIGDEDINGVFTFNVKDASTGIVVTTNSQSVYVPKGGVSNPVRFSIGSSCTPSRIILEAIAPGGAAASRTECIS